MVGISSKCPTWDWVVRNNIIERAGTGIYLGDSNGDAPFVRGTIELNLIVDRWATTWRSSTRTRDPRSRHADRRQRHGHPPQRLHQIIQRLDRGSRAPNVLVGHWPLSGPGQNDRYELYGNFFFQNDTHVEALFQGEGTSPFTTISS